MVRILCAAAGILLLVGCSTPPTTPPAVPATPTPAVGLSRDNPAPPRIATRAPNGMLLLVDAERGFMAGYRVREFNRLNPAPRMGHEYLLVSLAMSNARESDELEVVATSHFGTVGSSNNIFRPVTAVLDQPLSAQLLREGRVAGRVLFEVPEDEADLVLIYNPPSAGGQWFYLGLPR